jgi:hypothetical protein
VGSGTRPVQTKLLCIDYHNVCTLVRIGTPHTLSSPHSSPLPPPTPIARRIGTPLTEQYIPQSRQSARLFLRSSELGVGTPPPPTHSPAGDQCVSTHWFRGHTRLRGKERGEDERGDSKG